MRRMGQVLCDTTDGELSGQATPIGCLPLQKAPHLTKHLRMGSDRLRRITLAQCIPERDRYNLPAQSFHMGMYWRLLAVFEFNDEG